MSPEGLRKHLIATTQSPYKTNRPNVTPTTDSSRRSWGVMMMRSGCECIRLQSVCNPVDIKVNTCMLNQIMSVLKTLVNRQDL